jgi:hypothetical protein
MAEKMKRGRKPVFELDPTLSDKIINYLEQGLTQEMAYSQAGIGKNAFYRYLRENKEFREAVTHAGQKANVLAVIAFRSGLTEQRVNETQTETYTETRAKLDKKGELITYPYTKTTTRKVDRVMPRDWRAGKEWLERRDRENWGNKIEIMLGVKLDVLKELKLKADAAGVDLSQVFEQMVNQLGSISIGTGED